MAELGFMEYGSALRIGELPPFQPNETRTNIPRQTDHAPRNLQHKSVRCYCGSKTSSFGLALSSPCSNHQLFSPLPLSCRLIAGRISRGTPCFTCPFSSSSDHASQYPPKPPSSSPPPLPAYAASTSHCEDGPRKPDDDGTLHGTRGAAGGRMPAYLRYRICCFAIHFAPSSTAFSVRCTVHLGYLFSMTPPPGMHCTSAAPSKSEFLRTFRARSPPMPEARQASPGHLGRI